MRHHVLTAAMGLLIAAALVPTNSAQAASADPTGIWKKAEAGERPGKMEVFRCGSGKKYLCAKIVWLQDPLDSKGKPLHDIRNETPSLRGRPILGLPIINGMAPVGANQWKGNIYNPEDGNTYSATLTLVSRNQIHLKGCKAWLLCGERTWLRTSLPKPEPEPQIEASAEPEAQPASATASAEEQAQENVLSAAEMLTPADEPGTRPGYRFLNPSETAVTPVVLSGENVPSMFAMTAPIAGAEGATNAAAAAAPAAAPPAPKVKPQTIQANAASAPNPQPVKSAPRAAPAAPAPAAAEADEADPVETAETETADATAGEQSLTWRERRLLRRQQKQSPGLLPWQR